MFKNNAIEVNISNSTIRWYKAKGYEIPTHTVQLWATIKGKRVKNGIKNRVANNTKIMVKIEDLPPSSNVNIPLICPTCSKEFQTTYGAYLQKHSDNCSSCVKKKVKGDGSHGYWVNKLISENPKAACDISGETDKRFLVLHHLTSRGNGGRNIPDNYVVLSANYHLAFHVWNGGMGIPCTKEKYMQFKKQE